MEKLPVNALIAISLVCLVVALIIKLDIHAYVWDHENTFSLRNILEVVIFFVIAVPAIWAVTKIKNRKKKTGKKER